jgi:hypothetical protein
MKLAPFISMNTKLSFFIVIISCLLLIHFPTKACEVCGCGIGNNYFSLQPNLSKNFVGIRIRSLEFDSHLLMGDRFRTKEEFIISELFARVNVTERLQFIATLPYMSSKQQTTSQNHQLSGVSDVSVIANYNVFESQSMGESNNFKQSVIIGGGIKLPTGKYSLERANNSVENPNFQLGTGSLDYFVVGNYLVNFDKIGVSFDGTFRLTTQNSEQYTFGNRLISSAQVFYTFRPNNEFMIMPIGGFVAEFSGMDRKTGEFVSVTGGNALFASIGVESSFSFFAFGFSFSTPIQQNIGGGALKNLSRFQAHTSFLF